MEAPPIQCCRTEDGVSIAYWTLGEGPVLIHEQVPGASHVGLEWQHPSLRSWESGPLVRSSYHAESQIPGRGKIEPSLLVPRAGGERL